MAKAALLACSQVQGSPQGHAAKSCMQPWLRQPHGHASMPMACCQGHGSPYGLAAKACMLSRPTQTLSTQPRLRQVTLEVEARCHGHYQCFEGQCSPMGKYTTAMAKAKAYVSQG